MVVGKTRTGSEWILQRVKQGYKNIALIGATSADVRDVMVETGESSIIKIAPPELVPLYEPSKRRLSWEKYGAVATLFSAEDPDQLRGGNFDTAWWDEPAKASANENVHTQLALALRSGSNPRALYTTTPLPIKLIKELHNESQLVQGEGAAVHVTTGSTLDNQANLSPTFIAEIKRRYAHTSLWEQEVEGRILYSVEGALWTREVLDRDRVTQDQVPDPKMIAVSIDPTVGDGSKGTQDDCGITVGMLGKDDKGYLLADYTLKGSAQAWATKAIEAYRLHGADYILGEKNNGGTLITETLKAYGGPNIPVKLCWASTGKIPRAQPIAMLGEQSRIHHVGNFPKLEEELCSYTGSGKSPNRLDSYVWLFYSLMVENERRVVTSREFLL